MSAHSFNIIPIDHKEVKQQLNVSFNDVVFVLSSNQDWAIQLKAFLMHQWDPGRWMQCKFGFIYCVKGKGIQ